MPSRYEALFFDDDGPLPADERADLVAHIVAQGDEAGFDRRVVAQARRELLAGLRDTRWHDERQTWVSVYHTEDAGLGDASEGGRWAVVCERHGSILQVETLAVARFDVRHDPAEFCEECREPVCDDCGRYHDQPCISTGASS